jgi:hypothetical protein
MRIVTYLLAATLAAFLSVSLALADERPIVIAVVDTGYTAPKRKVAVPPRLCKEGHADFSGTGPTNINAVPKDSTGHGTNIVHIIANQIGNQHGYCIVVIKYYANDMFGSAEASGRAMMLARNIKANVVNFSSEGGSFEDNEEAAVFDMLEAGATVVVAAGNSGVEVDTYPAKTDQRVVVVGNLSQDGTRHITSNHGSLVNRWEIGQHVCGGGSCLSGTSQATAVATGKIVKEMLNERKQKCSKKPCQNTRK